MGRRRESSPGPLLAGGFLACANPQGSGLGRRGLVASVVIHALLVAGLIVLPPRLLRESEEPLRVDFVFYPEPAPLVEPVPKPAISAPEIDPPIEPVPPPAAPATGPPPIERPVIARDDRPSPHPVEREAPPPAPAVVASQPHLAKPEPTVRTDVFGSERAEPRASATPVPREARTNVFEEARGRVASLPDHPDRAGEDPVVARTGAFASDSSRRLADRPRPADLTPTEVGAFEVVSTSPRSTTPSGPPTSERTVIDAGFGSVKASRDTGETSSPAVTVKQGGFEKSVVVAGPRRPRPKPAPSPDVPVEIVSKPRPAYPELARELRVEGEVVLEVLFGASGRLRVLRVVRGLGHGLDDAAVEAAQRIDFKPALRNGKPIDYVATLRVVFQLA